MDKWEAPPINQVSKEIKKFHDSIKQQINKEVKQLQNQIEQMETAHADYR